MKDLNTTTPPSLRPSDFPDEISYDEWKREESKAISELMVNMIQSNPELAKSEPTEVRSSLLSDGDRPELRRSTSDTTSTIGLRYPTDIEQLNTSSNGKHNRPERPRMSSLTEDYDEFASKTIYTFIPEDPRAYYRRVVELCLQAQKVDGAGDEEEESLLSNAAQELLNECALRWRVHPAAQISLLLDVVRQLYDSDELGIQDIDEAFAVADYWNYPSWPNADVSILEFSVDILEILIWQSVKRDARNAAPQPLQHSSTSI
jgi:hypothetical protein